MTTIVVPTLPKPVIVEQFWPLVTKNDLTITTEKRQDCEYGQRGLNALGITDYEGKPLKADGIGGKRTLSAFGKLQKLAGIDNEKLRVGRWTWTVLDWLMYPAKQPSGGVGWTPASKTLSSALVVKRPDGTVLYKDPQPRTGAIQKGLNRYTGLVVNKMGISRECQKASDGATLTNPDWGRDFVAVDRHMGSSLNQPPSPHRWGLPRDWMADLNKNGSYREVSEIAKVDALVAYFADRARGWPMQTIAVPMRGDYSLGFNETIGSNGQPCGKTQRTLRFSGWDRLVKIVWNGYIFEWRFTTRTVDDKGQAVGRADVYGLGWWKLKSTSDQHRSHAHIEHAPILDGVILAA